MPNQRIDFTQADVTLAERETGAAPGTVLLQPTAYRTGRTFNHNGGYARAIQGPNGVFFTINLQPGEQVEGNWDRTPYRVTSVLVSASAPGERILPGTAELTVSKKKQKDGSEKLSINAIA